MQRQILKLSPEKTALFLFGIFFITVLIILAVAIPKPTDAQWRVFNVVLALVAAAIGTLLPGVLQVKLTPWLRAGGALAVFALVYLVKPAGLVTVDPFEPLPPPPGVERAKPVADTWIKLVDEKKYEEAYSSSYGGWRARYQKPDFLRLLEEVRSPLGKVIERKETGQQSGESTFGERGHVRIYAFVTRFEGASDLIPEFIWVFAKDEKSGWQPAGYSFDVQRAIATRIPVQSAEKK